MYVIKNGTLYTMDDAGVIQADLRVENGKITEIGAGLSTEGADVIDAAGKCVVPGFVDAHSHIGGLDDARHEDLNEITNPLTPELRHQSRQRGVCLRHPPGHHHQLPGPRLGQRGVRLGHGL